MKLAKYDKKKEKELEQLWKKYPYWCPPTRYDEGEAVSEYQELCRNIFTIVYGYGNVTHNWLRKVLNAQYDANICDSYLDGGEEYPGFVWDRHFTFEFNGFTIRLGGHVGNVYKNKLQYFLQMKGRHVSEYYASIKYNGMLIEEHQVENPHKAYMTILEKLLDSIKERMAKNAEEMNTKLKEMENEKQTD